MIGCKTIKYYANDAAGLCKFLLIFASFWSILFSPLGKLADRAMYFFYIIAPIIIFFTCTGTFK